MIPFIKKPFIQRIPLMIFTTQLKSLLQQLNVLPEHATSNIENIMKQNIETEVYCSVNILSPKVDGTDILRLCLIVLQFKWTGDF